ncbi:MAG TPA: GntR family transcriptional regulator [Blastocatellia bacterium]|nr:GntR family transcriptional regulator [Blastocatellia bacterium]HMX27660.1 GntR family transcriptional regulator [Blastocatellia bacterium]HMY74794.1 GntR family transcriptional regulator [Blastocatellia bacterium]HMZ22377.1 GntR family transcriptional regulator [Blastocatellia bacterium]HNG30648.1 GntR family transcriptional regulator [Blastocatellia bacterium]
MSQKKLQPDDLQGSLAQQAYELIRNAILKGDLALGAALSRRKLAEQLGMSFLPVSEALQRLEMEGLVESRPRVGTRVRVPTNQDIRGHYVIREALETQAARLYAEKASPLERRELQEFATRLDGMYADPQKDLFETFSAHERLHRRIAECTGCPMLVEAIEKSHILVFNWLYNSATHFRDLPRRWHQDLIRALNSGDVAVADARMREHCRYGMEEVLRRIEATLNQGDTRALTFTRAITLQANPPKKNRAEKK